MRSPDLSTKPWNSFTNCMERVRVWVDLGLLLRSRRCGNWFFIAHSVGISRDGAERKSACSSLGDRSESPRRKDYIGKAAPIAGQDLKISATACPRLGSLWASFRSDAPGYPASSRTERRLIVPAAPRSANISSASPTDACRTLSAGSARFVLCSETVHFFATLFFV
jgi:hypothetical protein